MTSVARKLTALGAVFLAVIGIAACGGVPSDSVATVEGNAIKKTSFEHWVNVAAAANAQSTGAEPVPLVPPNFSACISHYETAAAKEKSSKPPSASELKSTCEAQYKSIKTEVMKFLTSAEWVIGEAKKLGIKLTDEEVHNEFLKIKDTQFPSTATFEKFLKSSGQTVSDLLLRVKINMLSQKIEKKVIAESKDVSQEEIQKYYEQNKSQFGYSGTALGLPDPHQDRRRGQPGEEGNRRRQVLLRSRQGKVDRPGQPQQRRPGQGNRQGPGDQGALRSDLRRPAEPAFGTRQDALRLLHLRSQGSQAGQPETDQGRRKADQTPARRRQGAEGARQVHEGIR